METILQFIFAICCYGLLLVIAVFPLITVGYACLMMLDTFSFEEEGQDDCDWDEPYDN